MATTQSTRRPPPLRFAKLEQPLQYWELETQQSVPMREVDTSAGNYTEAPPSPGLSGTTGQTNQNQEISFTKISADGNTFTLTGVEGGPYHLTAQYSYLKIKSNGTVWRRTG